MKEKEDKEKENKQNEIDDKVHKQMDNFDMF